MKKCIFITLCAVMIISALAVAKEDTVPEQAAPDAVSSATSKYNQASEADTLKRKTPSPTEKKRLTEIIKEKKLKEAVEQKKLDLYPTEYYKVLEEE